MLHAWMHCSKTKEPDIMPKPGNFHCHVSYWRDEWGFGPLAFANNPQMGNLYDPTKPLNSILYVDANNLYVWAMSQFLPTGGFVGRSFRN